MSEENFNREIVTKVVYVEGHKYTKIQSKDLFSELAKYLRFPFPIYYTTLHWSASSYDKPHSNYHINIADDYILISNEIITRWHSHCYKRNRNNLGLTFMAMAGATERNAGKYPVTQRMIETCD